MTTYYYSSYDKFDYDGFENEPPTADQLGDYDFYYAKAKAPSKEALLQALEIINSCSDYSPLKYIISTEEEIKEYQKTKLSILLEIENEEKRKVLTKFIEETDKHFYLSVWKENNSLSNIDISKQYLVMDSYSNLLSLDKDEIDAKSICLAWNIKEEKLARIKSKTIYFLEEEN